MADRDLRKLGEWLYWQLEIRGIVPSLGGRKYR